MPGTEAIATASARPATASRTNESTGVRVRSPCRAAGEDPPGLAAAQQADGDADGQRDRGEGDRHRGHGGLELPPVKPRARSTARSRRWVHRGEQQVRDREQREQLEGQAEQQRQVLELNQFTRSVGMDGPAISDGLEPVPSQPPAACHGPLVAASFGWSRDQPVVRGAASFVAQPQSRHRQLSAGSQLDRVHAPGEDPLCR